MTLASTDFVPTVPLALWDFAPVLLASLGLVLLARHIGADRPSWGRTAFRGAVLVTLGGLAKAGWKLNYAVSGNDIDWLEEALFYLLAPGFAFVAAALSSPRWAPWWLAAIPPAFALGWLWPVVVMVLAIAGATATGVLCLLRARRAGEGVTAVLFGLQIALAFALVPLAAPPQTLGKQWAEESINAVAQAAFALGAWRLLQRRTTSPSDNPVREEVPA